MKRSFLVTCLLLGHCGGPGADPDDGHVSDTVPDIEDTRTEDVPTSDPAGDEQSEPDLAIEDVEGEDVLPSPCPTGMVLVDGSFCIDRFEAALEEQDTDGSWSPASPYDTVSGRTVRAVRVATTELQRHRTARRHRGSQLTDADESGWARPGDARRIGKRPKRPPVSLEASAPRNRAQPEQRDSATLGE